MRSLLFLILLLTVSFSFGQSEYQFGLLPSFNLNKSLPNDFKLNFELELRQQLERGVFGVSGVEGYDYILTDLTFVGAKRVGVNTSLATGYLFRIRGEDIIHRSIQQFIYTKKLPSFKLSHRVVADQTYQIDQNPIFRFRYRLATEFPLNGQSVDPGEFYLKVNNEYLNIFDSGDYDLEVRATPFLGYTLTANQKFEFGLDYRISSFLDGPSSQDFWIAINWYQSL